MKDVVQSKNIKYFMISAHSAILRTTTDSRESTDNKAAFKKIKKEVVSYFPNGPKDSKRNHQSQQKTKSWKHTNLQASIETT